jgi:hypothetical protein
MNINKYINLFESKKPDASGFLKIIGWLLLFLRNESVNLLNK